jgi:hypothetical protein
MVLAGIFATIAVGVTIGRGLKYGWIGALLIPVVVGVPYYFLARYRRDR